MSQIFMPDSTPMPRTRSTAVTRPASTPWVSRNDGTCGWKPWPHSQARLASMSKSASTSAEASITSTSGPAAGPVGSTTGSPDRSCGGVHSASIQSFGAIMALRKPTPARNSTPSYDGATRSLRAATTAAPASLLGLAPA